MCFIEHAKLVFSWDHFFILFIDLRFVFFFFFFGAAGQSKS